MSQFFKIPDYVNFKEKFESGEKFKGKLRTKFGTKTDERTRISTGLTVDCNDYELIKNYIEFVGDTVKWSSVTVNNQKFKCYSFLEFGMIPIVLLPIGILSYEQALSESMLAYATTELKLDTYSVPVIDFFTGTWRTSLNKNDIWVKRESLARALGKNPQNVHTKDFFEAYANYSNIGENNAS